MSKFNGNNNSKTLKTAFERANYKLNAFSDSEIQVVDFNFAERTFYGRVNRQIDPVIPNENFIRNFHNQDFRIMNFVGDQFKEMYVRYSNALNLSLINNEDPNLSELSVIRGWEDPINLYSNFMASFMDSFLLEKMIPNEKKIHSFDDFLNIFEAHVLENDIDSKITLSGFMKSRQSSIFNTGLALQLAPVGFADDSAKENTILNSPNYAFFMNMAKQFGFSVNLQNPSVLVSDLAHPTTTKFRERYELFNVTRIFERQYLRTYNYDFDLLSQYLMDTYNSFVYLKPNLKEVYVCNNKTKSNISKRNNINSIDYIIILLLYIKIRNMEEVFPFSDSEMKSIHSTSVRLFDITPERSMQFIEAQFRSRYNTKEGSLTYYKKKFQK
tara:strand:- start:1034 stop:2185 length:1152 start_codon:yes stop_codon:yes gene_type:complete